MATPSRIAVALASLAVCIATPVWAAKLDLYCQGHTHMTAGGKVLDKPMSQHASVDFDRMQFCWRDSPCKLLPVRRVALPSVTLRDEHPAQGHLSFVVDMKSGHYVSDIDIRPSFAMEVVGHEEGRCIIGPFTPF